MVDPATWVLFGAQVFALALWLRFYQRWTLKEFLASLVPIEIVTLLYILVVGEHWEWLFPELSLAKAFASKGIRLFCFTNLFLGLPWIAGFVVATLRRSWIKRRANI